MAIEQIKDVGTGEITLREIQVPEQVIIVPSVISMRQCQLALYAIDAGVTLAAVDAAVLGLSVPAQIEWKTSAEVWRSSPMVELMRTMFGWTIEQMDQLFIDAEGL